MSNGIPNVGEHGGRVRRSFPSRDLIYEYDDLITPQTALGWPISNRLALQNTGYIEWFKEPVVALLEQGDGDTIEQPDEQPPAKPGGRGRRAS